MVYRFWPLRNWRCKSAHINCLSPCLSLYAGLTTLQLNGFSLNFILESLIKLRVLCKQVEIRICRFESFSRISSITD